MSDQSRALPGQPNLRYLKVEAKRRLSGGEFATLHDAQLAIAREHGLPSWAALKQYISAGAAAGSPVLAQARWLISRFVEAGTPGWRVPGDDELREHFDGHFLRLIPPETLVRTLTGVVSRLREELVITLVTPRQLRARIGGMQMEAAAAAGPPHRLTGLRLYPLGERVTDPRVAAPSTRTSGEVPPAAAAVAEESLAELGLPGLVLAGAPGGAGPDDGAAWVAARGWASLEGTRLEGAGPEEGTPGASGPAVRLSPGHRFPAYSVTKLVTATVILRLVADGRIGLDDPACAHLRTVTLADSAITVRDLLTHTAGVDTPGELFAGRVPDLATLTGPVVRPSGRCWSGGPQLLDACTARPRCSRGYVVPRPALGGQLPVQLGQGVGETSCAVGVGRRIAMRLAGSATAISHVVPYLVMIWARVGPGGMPGVGRGVANSWCAAAARRASASVKGAGEASGG